MDKEVENTVENICENMINGKKKNSKPLCILIGGLPGSGKTNLVEKLKQEYSDRDFIVIDTDDYRKLYRELNPAHYQELMKNPEKAIEETSNFSNAIEAELIKRAIKERCDIISVTTLRATESIDKILYEPAINSNYSIQACVMSVPVNESGLSAQIRYERQIKNGECPRFTPMNFIESSFSGIRNTLQMLQNKKDEPTIRIYNRGNGENSMPIEIYNSKKANTRYCSVIDALVNPRKSVTKDEASIKLNQLYELKKSRNANNIEYSSLERLEEQFGIENEKNR